MKNENINETRSGAAVGSSDLLGLSDDECDCIGCELRNKSENHGQRNREQRNTNGNPRADSIGSAESPLQLMLTEQTVAPSIVVIPTGNPLAQFLVRLVAKFVGVRFFLHGVVERPNG